MTHICVNKIAIIDSDNGLSPSRRQAIIWTNVGILLIGPLGTNFSEILIEIHTSSFKKSHLKMSSWKRRPFCLDLNVLTRNVTVDKTHICTLLSVTRTFLSIKGYRVYFFQTTYWRIKQYILLLHRERKQIKSLLFLKHPFSKLWHWYWLDTSRWRHNERDGIPNYQPHDCLLNHLLRCRSNKTSKLDVTGLCEGKSAMTAEFPAQRASNAGNVPIWSHHHACI